MHTQTHTPERAEASAHKQKAAEHVGKRQVIEHNPRGRATKVRHAAAVVYLCLLAAFGGSGYLVLTLICHPLSIPPSGDIHTVPKKSNKNQTEREKL